MNWIEEEKIPSDKNALFLHTGGTPGIFTMEHTKAMQNELWMNKQTIYEYKEN